MTEPTPHPADPEARFRAALANDPNDRQALLGLAGLLKLQERPQEALVLSEDVLGREPRHGEAWLTRGDALFNLDRYGDAVESCRRAFIRRDLAYDALMRLGQAFSAMGRCDLVIESLDAAVTLRPDSGDARFRRAWLRLKFGQYAEGWEGLRAALALRAVRGRLISLQYDDAPAEVAAVNAGRAAPIRTLPEEATRDFEELAALVAKLDVWSLGADGRRSSLRRAWNAVSDPCPAEPGVALWAQAPATPWYRSVRLFPSPRRARGRRRSRRSPRSFAVAFLSAPSRRGLRHDGPSRR